MAHSLMLMTAAVLLSLSCSLSGSAETVHAPEHEHAQQFAIDVRLMSEPVAEPRYVVFAARPAGDASIFGHAFLMFWGADSQRKTSVSAAIGFYPEDPDEGKNSFFRLAHGKLADEHVDRGSVHKATHLLRVRVTDAQFQALMRHLERREIEVHIGIYRYGLTANNCIDFVHDVIEVMNQVEGSAKLAVPERPRDTDTMLPEHWIETLIALNKDTGSRDELPEQFLPLRLERD